MHLAFDSEKSTNIVRRYGICTSALCGFRKQMVCQGVNIRTTKQLLKTKRRNCGYSLGEETSHCVCKPVEQGLAKATTLEGPGANLSS